MPGSLGAQTLSRDAAHWSFKTRGAFELLTREVPEAGVVAASGGNHGVGVAYAAHKLGKPARIFVPTVASRRKWTAYAGTERTGGKRGSNTEALVASERWARESGATEVHAYNKTETSGAGDGRAGIEANPRNLSRCWWRAAAAAD